MLKSAGIGFAAGAAGSAFGAATNKFLDDKILDSSQRVIAGTVGGAGCGAAAGAGA